MGHKLRNRVRQKFKNKSKKKKIIWLKTYTKTSKSYDECWKCGGRRKTCLESHSWHIDQIPHFIEFIHQMLYCLLVRHRYTRTFGFEFILNLAVRVCAKINTDNENLVNFEHFWIFNFQHINRYRKRTACTLWRVRPTFISKKRNQSCRSRYTEYPKYIFYFLLWIWALSWATYAPPCKYICICIYATRRWQPHWFLFIVHAAVISKF